PVKSGNVGMLLEGPMEYIESRPYLEQIDRVAQRAAAIAEQMLAYSGSGNIAQEPIDLAEVIRQMRPFIQTIVSKKAKVEYALDCPVPPVIGDAAQLRQVLINLLLNASEALNGKPGIIGVEAGVKRCRADDFSCLACGDSLPEGEYVVITVRDTGCGMDSDTAAKIFDPFFSTKFIGRGLGLAAVLGIVRGHNGGIAVSSHPDQGAQFLVYLPVNRLADEMPRDISVCCGAPLARQTVMIVDDEELLLAMAERIMRRAGFRVLKAGDGRAAVEVFRAYREEISVVILDLMMPELSGEETMLELRRLDPRVRILFSSGYSEHAISPEIINSALTGFIKKPYRPVQLLAAVERLRKEEIRE
ncbi:MAG TPA: response regulator, partial [Oligoflexia bacterium]|nr:response regulator [Oligoflexia bacterium]